MKSRRHFFMKRIGLIVLVCCSLLGRSQNIVPNPSFELNDSCPSWYSQFLLVQQWGIISNSCDYFNECASNPVASVPSNAFGWQYAASGQGYSGVYVYAGTGACGTIGYREYIGCPLFNPLSIGTRYFISLKVSPTTSSTTPLKYATNRVGVNFLTTIQSPFNQFKTINHSVLYSNNVISDTANWTKVFGSFMADSQYAFLGIGNFFVDSLTDTINIGGTADCAYFYIDDVCVSTDSVYAANYVWTGTDEAPIEINAALFPNPNSGSFTLNYFLPHGSSGKMEIYNLLGEKVYEQELKKNSREVQVNLSLAKGIYLCRVVSGNETRSVKFVVE